MTLDKLPIGKSAVIVQIGGEGALRCRLLDMGLIPRTRVQYEKPLQWATLSRFIFVDMNLRSALKKPNR